MMLERKKQSPNVLYKTIRASTHFNSEVFTLLIFIVKQKLMLTHRITELLKWQETFEIITSKCSLRAGNPMTTAKPSMLVYHTLHLLRHREGDKQITHLLYHFIITER